MLHKLIRAGQHFQSPAEFQRLSTEWDHPISCDSTTQPQIWRRFFYNGIFFFSNFCLFYQLLEISFIFSLTVVTSVKWILPLCWFIGAMIGGSPKRVKWEPLFCHMSTLWVFIKKSLTIMTHVFTNFTRADWASRIHWSEIKILELNITNFSLETNIIKRKIDESKTETQWAPWWKIPFHFILLDTSIMKDKKWISETELRSDVLMQQSNQHLHW